MPPLRKSQTATPICHQSGVYNCVINRYAIFQDSELRSIGRQTNRPSECRYQVRSLWQPELCAFKLVGWAGWSNKSRKLGYARSQVVASPAAFLRLSVRKVGSDQATPGFCESHLDSRKNTGRNCRNRQEKQAATGRRLSTYCTCYLWYFMVLRHLGRPSAVAGQSCLVIWQLHRFLQTAWWSSLGSRDCLVLGT